MEKSPVRTCVLALVVVAEVDDFQIRNHLGRVLRLAYHGQVVACLARQGLVEEACPSPWEEEPRPCLAHTVVGVVGSLVPVAAASPLCRSLHDQQAGQRAEEQALVQEPRVQQRLVMRDSVHLAG
jgi:hypothetical protein